MKRKYEEQEGLVDGSAGLSKVGRKPRKTTVRVSSAVMSAGGTAILTSGGAAGHQILTTAKAVYGGNAAAVAGGSGVVTGLQAGSTQYSIVHGTVSYPHQPQYHRTPMATWNPPVVFNPTAHSTPQIGAQQQQHHQSQVWVAAAAQQQSQQQQQQQATPVVPTFKQEPVDPLALEHNYNENTPPPTASVVSSQQLTPSHQQGAAGPASSSHHLTPSHHHSDDSEFGTLFSPLK